MAVVGLLEGAHILLKKPLHKRRVRRHFVIRRCYQCRQEHGWASSSPISRYGIVLKLDEGTILLLRDACVPLPLRRRLDRRTIRWQAREDNCRSTRGREIASKVLRPQPNGRRDRDCTAAGRAAKS